MAADHLVNTAGEVALMRLKVATNQSVKQTKQVCFFHEKEST